MQIKYATTILSATFLVLQASIPMVSATPIGAFTDNDVKSMNG